MTDIVRNAAARLNGPVYSVAAAGATVEQRLNWLEDCLHDNGLVERLTQLEERVETLHGQAVGQRTYATHRNELRFQIESITARLDAVEELNLGYGHTAIELDKRMDNLSRKWTIAMFKAENGIIAGKPSPLRQRFGALIRRLLSLRLRFTA